MTTIAASLTHGEMAADTKACAEGVTFQCTKIFHVGEMIVGYCGGDSADGESWLEWLRNGSRGRKPEIDKESDFSGLALGRAGLFWIGWDCRMLPVENGRMAVGSGTQAALAGLHLGMTPGDAVELACKVDNNSGPPVTVLRLKGKRRGNTSA